MPHYMNSACIAPATPAKRVNVANGMFRWFLNLLNRLNYVTSTQSFQAKVRSQNPPKQCLEAGPRKRLPLSKVLIESQASLSDVGMQRSCKKLRHSVSRALGFYSSLELGKESERDFNHISFLTPSLICEFSLSLKKKTKNVYRGLNPALD